MKKLAILMFSFLAVSHFSSCKKDDNCVIGSGVYTSRNYSKTNFNSIHIYGEADVYITKNSIPSIRIEAQNNILNALNVSVSNEELSVGDDNCFKDAKKLKIYLSMNSLRRINLEGVCNVFSPDKFSGQSFDAIISGTSNMDVNVDVQEFKSHVSGKGNIKAKGSAQNHDIFISGSGMINSFDLIGQNADINVSGSGNVEVLVSNNLDVTIKGSCNVYYKGNPTIKSNISGSGNIINSN